MANSESTPSATAQAIRPVGNRVGFDHARSEELRRWEAESFGLPPAASWAEINACYAEQARQVEESEREFFKAPTRWGLLSSSGLNRFLFNR